MRRPNFLLAFLLAPLAGALAAFLTALVFIALIGTAAEQTFRGAITTASMIAFYALVICLAYSLIIGLGVVIFVRMTRRVPSLLTAIIVGLIAGGIPFGVVPLFDYMRRTPALYDALMFPSLAIAASIATAWAFWRFGLRGRSVAPLA